MKMAKTNDLKGFQPLVRQEWRDWLTENKRLNFDEE